MEWRNDLGSCACRSTGTSLRRSFLWPASSSRRRPRSRSQRRSLSRLARRLGGRQRTRASKRCCQIGAEAGWLREIRDAGIGPLVRRREPGGSEQLVPERGEDAEVLVEVARLQRVMDAVEAVVDEDAAERPEVQPGRRVQVVAFPGEDAA